MKPQRPPKLNIAFIRAILFYYNIKRKDIVIITTSIYKINKIIIYKKEYRDITLKNLVDKALVD